jgi:TetR/AcrR family transcriptional regulator, regulator of autoinduction and epiphytic fitness
MRRVKRKYESSHRRALAEQTRAQILQSARRLFVQQGYANTTIAEIAKEAGVSEPTVYAAFGGKRAILVSLLDEMEKAADASELREFLGNKANDSRALLRAFVDFSVLFFTRGADIIRVAEAAGVGDPDLAALWQLGDARRYAACENVVAVIVEREELRRDVDSAQATDVLWALCGAEAYSLFVTRRGWSTKSFGDWLYDTLLAQLIGSRSS